MGYAPVDVARQVLERRLTVSSALSPTRAKANQPGRHTSDLPKPNVNSVHLSSPRGGAMEPVARLLETWETVATGKSKEVSAEASSESMALNIVQQAPCVTASPSSIAAMLGDKPPEELFLPGAYGYETAASCRAAKTWEVPSWPASEQKGESGGFVSLLKAELSLRDALQQKGEDAPEPSFASLLADARRCSLAELVGCIESDEDDAKDIEEE